MRRLLRRAGLLAGILSLLLPAAASAAWPGSNGMIAFNLGGGIAVVNADGTNLVQMPFPENGMSAGYPSWSPDGNWLVYSASTRETFPFDDVYAVRADGTGLRRLTTDPAYDMSPSFTPDGSRVLFSRPVGKLMSVNPDGTGEYEIVHDGSHYDSAPRMNPAGTRILFERNLQSEGIELWSMAPDGSDVRFVANGNVADWAPDGSRITWPSTGTSGFDEIWTMAPDGSDQQPLYVPASSESEVFNPSYSPDGKYIVSTRSIATSHIPGTQLPLLWATEVANPANHSAIWPNPASPSQFDDYGYVFDAVWQPCLAGVTATCRTVKPAPPGGGGPGGGGSPGAPILPPGGGGAGNAARPKAARNVSVARRQRGARVKVSLKLAVAPATVTMRAKNGPRTLGIKIVNVATTGTRRITLKLNAQARKMLRRKGKLGVGLMVRASSPKGRTTTVFRSVTLRR